jgi:hypothetical protein
MDSDPTFLSEEEAARLWQRAAQLQAEATRKAEELAQAADGAHETAPESKDGDAPGGYALTHVRSAALEVGIGSEFMDAALADLRAERALPQRKRLRPTRWLLRDAPDTLTARRVIEASVSDVLSATEASWSSTFRDSTPHFHRVSLWSPSMAVCGRSSSPSGQSKGQNPLER